MRNPIFKLILLGLICGAAVLFLWGGPFEKAVSDSLFRKIKSAKALMQSARVFNISVLFRSKNDLYKENLELSGRLRELEAKTAILEFSSKISTSKDFLAATVIMRPPAIVYDQIIVDKGLKDSVKIGDIVLAGESVILGKVSEVFDESSRVILLSSYGLENNVFLEKAGVSASVSGYGNGELRAALPRDFNIKTGDRVFSLTDPKYFVGFVEKTNFSSNSPTKNAIIKQPFNVYGLFSVSIVR